MSTPNEPHLFCFGLSYTARALINHLIKEDSQANWHVTATLRQEEDLPSFTNTNLTLVKFGSKESFNALGKASVVLSSVPPGKDEDPVIRAYAGAFKNAQPEWVGYLSTTGPYGDCAGAWAR